MPPTVKVRTISAFKASPQSLLKPSVLRFRFKDFASLSHQSNDSTFSDVMVDNQGNGWKLELNPGGGSDSNTNDPGIGLYLYNKSKDDLVVSFTLIVRDSLGKAYDENSISDARTIASMGNLGWANFGLRRSTILDEENNVLVDGALLIDAHIQLKPKKKAIHIPSNPFAANMLGLLENEEDADVTFMVKKTKISAHKLILKMNAPVLYGFCEDQGEEGKAILIKETTPKIFKIVLRYVYGGDVPDSVTIEMAKDIIDAADRYEVTGLKLAVETTLVEALMLNDENFSDWLLYADSKTLPLLKEQAMNYFVSRAADLVNLECTEKLRESPKIMEEMMVVMSSSNVVDARFNNTGVNMTVNELRKKLDKEGLDVDGSKEALVSRLQEANKRQRTE